MLKKRWALDPGMNKHLHLLQCKLLRKEILCIPFAEFQNDLKSGLYGSQKRPNRAESQPIFNAEAKSKDNVWQTNEHIFHLSAHQSKPTRDHPATHRQRDRRLIVIRGWAVFTDICASGLISLSTHEDRGLWGPTRSWTSAERHMHSTNSNLILHSDM